MSTYTDLKNVVKETVTVNYDDRYTNQKVKLFNEENEFWGTYHGTLAGDATLKGMGIDSAKIENSTLKDVEISGCPQLDALSGMLSALKAGTAATTSYISAVVDANKSELEQKIDQIDTDYDKVRRYAQLITDLSDSVDVKVSALGQGIKTNAEDILAMGLTEKADYRALSGLVGRMAGDLSAQVSVELLSANTRIDELLLSCQSNLDTVEDCVKLANNVDDRRAVGDYNLSIWVHEIQNYVETVLSNATELSNLDTVMERLDEVTAIVDSAVSTVYDLSVEMAEYAGEIEGISSMAGRFDTRIDQCNSAIHVMNDTFNLFVVNMGTMLSNLVKRMDDFATDSAKQEDLELSVGNLADVDSYISGVIDQKAFLSSILTAAVEDTTKTKVGLKPGLSVDVLVQHQDITGKLDKNDAIVAATKCKVTYDAKGLVTSGSDLVLSDLPNNIPTSKITGLGSFASKNSLLSTDIPTIDTSKVSGLGSFATKSSLVSSDIPTINASKVSGLGDLALKDNLVSGDIPSIPMSKIAGIGTLAGKNSLASSDIPTIPVSKVSGLGSFATKSSLLSSEIPVLNSTKISDLGTLANKNSITSGDISGSLKLAQLGGVAAALAPFKGLVYDDGYDVDIETVISALVQLANMT